MTNIEFTSSKRTREENSLLGVALHHGAPDDVCIELIEKGVSDSTPVWMGVRDSALHMVLRYHRSPAVVFAALAKYTGQRLNTHTMAALMRHPREVFDRVVRAHPHGIEVHGTTALDYALRLRAHRASLDAGGPGTENLIEECTPKTFPRRNLLMLVPEYEGFVSWVVNMRTRVFLPEVEKRVWKFVCGRGF